MGRSTGLTSRDQNGMRLRYCDAGYYAAPAIVEVDNDGGSGAFTVQMPSYCPWTLTENLNWVTVTSAMSGTGTTIVQFTATPNMQSKPRSGAIRINGRSITIKQIPPGWE
jgi:hypothetical protein